ncbi:hypothetical protein TcarDRAFT_2403 [Thermosinus carboxydivorans Nor1]|uniref:Uncharacterized protein n=1 Tax=Thermosinus carboxydivorans Nor1 TaxID=401526 RepID=A1HNV1_9FIRM|nr:hypothetical protein [Thermosinus carboxydivorans]EAX48453.1 hypothetical protein TcarDRAFT_2403 [Thermosinus carboxydivorans Nor1]
MNGYRKKDDQYYRLITEARKCFERQEREKACYWYAQAGLHQRPDAEMRDLADFLVVAIEFRPELAGDIARLLLAKSEPLPPLYIQDLFFCALTIADHVLEQEVTKRVLAGPLTPNLCVRIADMYFEYAADRRHQVRAAQWIRRATETAPLTFDDWAAKAYAFYLLLDDEKAPLAVLGCAQRCVELAETTPTIDLDALQDLVEALSILDDGSIITKHLYDKILANNLIPLPDKHRIWQEIKGNQGYL